MSGQSSARRSPRKKSQNRPPARPRPRAENEFEQKILENSIEFSKKDLESVTDWRSDDFDPVAFLYSDFEPVGLDPAAKPADSVAQLFARFDREDGITIGTLKNVLATWPKEIQKAGQ